MEQVSSSYRQRAFASSSTATPEPDDQVPMPPFKKAKYAWQIKGRRTKKVLYKDERAALQRDQGLVPSLSSHVSVKNDADKDDPRPEADERVQQTEASESCRPHQTENDSCGRAESNETGSAVDALAEVRVHEDVALSARSLVAAEEDEQRLAAEDPCAADPVHNAFSPAHMVAQCMEQFLSTLNRTNYSLRKWQTKQIAKGVIDNAINKVLEEMGFTPLPADALHAELVGAAVAGDISPQNIENEGVSEAIRQRGLRRHHYRHNPLARSLREAVGSSSGESDAPVLSSAGDPAPGDCQQSHHPSAPCTCWLYRRNAGHRKRELPTTKESRAVAVQQSFGKSPQPRDVGNSYLEEEAEAKQDDLLDAAVTFAISEQGLGLLTDPDAT